MSRILPYPTLSTFLLMMWLLLHQSLSLGQIILGALVAVVVGLAMRGLNLEQTRLGRPLLILQLLGIVLYDVARSNIAVAWVILTTGRRPGTSGFMSITLDLRHRTALAVLAVILTATPGTVWLEFDAVSGRLLIHVLDLVDEQAWVDLIKQRYERLLLEIVS